MREAFGKDDRLEMAGLVGERDDAELVAGLGPALGASTVGRVAASVLDRAERRTKTGNKLGIVTLSDQTGHFAYSSSGWPERKKPTASYSRLSRSAIGQFS
jgi:hypothetical protein